MTMDFAKPPSGCTDTKVSENLWTCFHGSLEIEDTVFYEYSWHLDKCQECLKQLMAHGLGVFVASEFVKEIEERIPTECIDQDTAKILWLYLTRDIGLKGPLDRVHHHLHITKCNACGQLLSRRCQERYAKWDAAQRELDEKVFALFQTCPCKNRKIASELWANLFNHPRISMKQAYTAATAIKEHVATCEACDMLNSYSTIAELFESYRAAQKKIQGS